MKSIFRKKKLFAASTIPLLILLFFIIRYVRTVSEDDWNSISVGMSVERVEERLGNPSEDITETREMLDIVNEHRNQTNELLTYVQHTEVTSDFLEFDVERLDIIHQGIQADEDMRIYVYPVRRESEVRDANIYFFEDQVIHYTGNFEN